MSSACTCHIDPKQCWWCLYEVEKAKVQQYKKALEFYAYPEMYKQHHYHSSTTTAVQLDGGSLARKALEGME
ncbi:hypothetical protein MKZ02_20210 [Pseudobacillus sp. FSL P4-0506]|uniref:hypothetical protein n=1 Tax=Pseudobacillus sp. FSL P4-0506 TaxID=2921576 RepID=UPI0030F6018F